MPKQQTTLYTIQMYIEYTLLTHKKLQLNIEAVMNDKLEHKDMSFDMTWKLHDQKGFFKASHVALAACAST
jgi:hypothetical protein